MFINGYNLPIYNYLKTYSEKKANIFHMPGHKLSKGIPYELTQDILKLDITEIYGSDNLHCPEGIIRDAQQLAAQAFGAEHTFFLVNGSTCGVQAALLSVCQRDDIVLVSRDAHKSFLAALILSGARPVFIQPRFDENFSISAEVSINDIKSALDKYPEAKAVFLTRPNYYGICCDIQQISNLVHSKGKVLIVDEAHGAHLGFCEQLPQSSIRLGADICIQSAHKTLPALTQSAYLHVRGPRIDMEKLRFNLAMLQTSSPSYILMAFLDIAREIMQKEGGPRLDNLVANITIFINDLHSNTSLCALTQDALPRGIENDITRLVINTRSSGLTGYEAEKVLRKSFNTYIEMSDYQNIVLISTIADDIISFSKLYTALKEIDRQGRYNMPLKKQKIVTLHIPRVSMTPSETYYAKKETISLHNSCGRICAGAITPYPPGIPVIYPGEVFEEDTVDYLENTIGAGGSVIGITDGCVLVVS